MSEVIPSRSGRAFKLAKGARLKVTDPRGEQVADLLAAFAGDTRELMSSGRTFDYMEKIYLSAGDTIYSNRSRPLLTIIEDSVGRHDFLLTPCSEDTFRIIYGDRHPHRGCLGNLVEALAPYGIGADAIPACFNIFMNVELDSVTGKIAVKPPLSKANDFIVFRAEQDLIIGLTACSAPQSNNYSFKPIEFEILP